MRGRGARLTWWLLAAACCWLVWDPGDRLAGAARTSRLRREASLKQALERQPGLIYLFSFDEPGVRDLISGRSALCAGTVSVPGRHGRARKFDGRGQTSIECPLIWPSLGETYTLAMWLKITGRNRDQDIFCSAGEGLRTGLRLEGGRLTFDVPAKERQAISYDFRRYGEFVHVAAVVDSARGRAALYEDGRLMATGAVRTVTMPKLNMAFGKPLWYSARHPFEGVIDDTAVWNRPLAQHELAGLARARHGLPRAFSRAGTYARWRLAGHLETLLRHLANLRDLPAALAPEAPPTRRARREIPDLRLRMPAAERRHFIAAHRRSRDSGRRTQAAASPRRVYVACDGVVRTAWLTLHGSDTAYANALRPGYVLEMEGEGRLLGLRRLLLVPPESGGWLLPATTARLRALAGVPAVSNGLCRLSLNDTPRGIYLYSDHERQGVLPGDLPGMCDEIPRLPNSWRTIFRLVRPAPREHEAARRRWPLPATAVRATYAATESELGPILLHDLQSPLSGRAIAGQLRADAARLQDLFPTLPEGMAESARAAAFLDEFAVLGSNASPFRLVAPLHLDRPPTPGVTVSWHSSDPSLLGDDGRVHRPTNGAPRSVQLTARFADGRTTHEKSLHFRVMPAHIALPTLLLHVDQPLSKTRRVDAVAQICAPGEDFPGRCLTATQGTRGGLSHRGNSSYWYNKKLLSLETDAPHHVFDDSDATHLQTVNSLQDPSFVRNRLAYGLFRDWCPAGEMRPAPRVVPAEIFVNGRYHGLFEVCTRVDEALLAPSAGEAQHWAAVGGRWVFYRHETIRPRSPAMRARRPPPRDGLFMEPYLALEEFMSRPPDAAWSEELLRRIDESNTIDYQLLLNLTQNLNGAPFAFLAHESLVLDRASGRFFFVPWDFDFSLPASWRWIACDLMRRCEADVPGYRARMASRWRQLRQGSLSHPALAERITALAQPLEGYAEWDYERWKYRRVEPYRRHVSSLLTTISNNVVAVDAYLRTGGN